jgi:aspartate/methionine/tyrosine aminotransferase
MDMGEYRVFARRTNWTLTQNRYTEAVESYRASGRRTLDLTASNPTTIGLRYDERRIREALTHPNALRYEPASKGILTAREAVSSYYAELGTTVSADNLVLTVSTSEAYSYCFRLICDPGDEVLIPAPSYPLFEFLADLQDVKLVPYELVYDHGWQIEFESLTRAITPRSRAVMVVHPNNPTGSYLKQWEIDRLNEVCREHSLAIVADEVFLDYNLEPGEMRPTLAANRGALTFTLSGLSKISALPQIKVAWLCVSGPEDLARNAMARLEVIADTYLSPNAPVQWAIHSLLETRRDIQQQLCARVRANLAELDSQLASHSALSRMRVEGGWYAVLRVPVTQTDEELAVALLENQGVLIHPGHFFDFPCDGYLVLSLITPEAEFKEGVRRMLEFLRA